MMGRTNHVLLVGLVMGLVILSGCSGNQSIKEINYYEGSDGLVISFMDNNPPEVIYPDMQYPVTLYMHNLGAFSLLPSEKDDLYASVTLVYDPFYFSEVSTFSDTAKSIRDKVFIEGKSVFWPTGENKPLTLSVLEANDIGSSRVGADTDIVASVCYPYETKLTTQVCVDNDPFDDSDEFQPCHSEDLNLVDQGAPVAVTHVEVISTPVGTRQEEVLIRQAVIGENGELVGMQSVFSPELVTVVRPSFRLTIENVGDGQVIRGRERGEQKLCLREEGDDLPSNSVVVSGFLGNRELLCSPDPIVLRDNKAEVMCMLKPEDDIVSTTNYFDILQVYVDYVYQVRESVTVQIDDSMKQYTPPDYRSFKCQDFDNDYERCKAFASSLSDYSGDLDCYYCDALKKCGLSADCGVCPDGNIADPSSRYCSDTCLPPTVTVELREDDKEVLVICTDDASVIPNKRESCGCSSLSYKFIKDTPIVDADFKSFNAFSCENQTGYDVEVVGDRERNRMITYVDIPDSYQNDYYHFCVVGKTSGTPSVISKPAGVSYQYISDEINYDSDGNSVILENSALV